MSKLVRIKPYNPKRGHLLRKYTHGPSGMKFEEKLGWYKVDDALADYLATVPQQQSDPDSPPAFDVLEEEDARQVDAREKAQAEARKAADEATDLTSIDLRTGTEETPFAERTRMRGAAVEKLLDKAKETKSKRRAIA